MVLKRSTWIRYIYLRFSAWLTSATLILLNFWTQDCFGSIFFSITNFAYQKFILTQFYFGPNIIFTAKIISIQNHSWTLYFSWYQQQEEIKFNGRVVCLDLYGLYISVWTCMSLNGTFRSCIFLYSLFLHCMVLYCPVGSSLVFYNCYGFVNYCQTPD